MFAYIAGYWVGVASVVVVLLALKVPAVKAKLDELKAKIGI